MALPFVQGFLASLTLDGNDITLSSTDVALSDARTSLDKSVMDGSGESQSIPGKRSGTLAITGHIDQANLNLMQASYQKDVPVAFTLTIEEGLTTDASWAGTLTITEFNKETSAEGNWAFTLIGDTIGVVFTPSTP